MTLPAPRPIESAEFRERQLAVAAATRARGLDGLLIWSSCGSALDSFGNVFYLTNHYSPVPRVNVDIAPFMTGWGQAAVLLTADGELVLVTENGDYRSDLIVAGRVRHSRDVYDEAARALGDIGLGEARIGLVGASCLPLAAWQVISGRAPRAAFEPADDILFGARARKSPAEVAWMRHACAVGCEIQTSMLRRATPGATDADLVAEAQRVCLEHGAVPWDFAFASGPASGHGYWSRLPPWDRHRPYGVGDLIHPDAYGCVDGYFYDLQRSLVVGAEPGPRLRWLLDGVVGVVEALCGASRPGVRAASVARLRDEWLGDYGYQDPAHGMEGREGELMEQLVACGHGLGLGFELPWIDSSSDWVLEPSMTIALEVYLSEPGVGTVAFEHVVLVTDGEPEILTLGCPARWW
jgi:Xaa-Pro aminopeptidase